MVCQHSAQVVQTSLARAIGKGLERGDTETINAANVDNARRVIGTRGLLQERSHESRKIEDTVKVESEHSGEGLGGILVVGGTPIRARVVDQDVELCTIGTRMLAFKSLVSEIKQRLLLTGLALAQLLSQPLHVLVLVEIGGNRVGLALAKCIELLDSLVAGLRIARRNIDRGAVCNITLRDHAANALCATGDQHHLALWSWLASG